MPASYWDLEATFEPLDRQPDAAGPSTFAATLLEVDGTRVAAGRDFDEQRPGRRATAWSCSTRRRRWPLRDALVDRPVAVRSVERKPYTRKPYPPFITSSAPGGGRTQAALQLEPDDVARADACTRTASSPTCVPTRTTLSDTALNAARTQILERVRPGLPPRRARTYTRKVKNAQEAHEAIRPAGDTFRTPDEVRSELGTQEFRLYELIWQRTVASQMADARGESVSVRLGDHRDRRPRRGVRRVSGRTIQFPGFLRAYVEGAEVDGGDTDDSERVLPEMNEGDAARTARDGDRDHETQPPARFTEASLVKRLEELGVGRPSTYAATISTILDRGYVRKKGSALVPSFTAFAVVTLLERHFADLVDYALTARMEDDLDRIANGDADTEPWLARFYFGDQSDGGGQRCQAGA